MLPACLDELRLDAELCFLLFPFPFPNSCRQVCYFSRLRSMPSVGWSCCMCFLSCAEVVATSRVKTQTKTESISSLETLTSSRPRYCRPGLGQVCQDAVEPIEMSERRSSYEPFFSNVSPVEGVSSGHGKMGGKRTSIEIARPHLTTAYKRLGKPSHKQNSPFN